MQKRYEGKNEIEKIKEIYYLICAIVFNYHNYYFKKFINMLN